jgi:hypothetical protein
MTLTVPGLIVLVVIAAICGAVCKALGGGPLGGLTPRVWSIIGAALFVALLQLMSGRRWARP